MNRNNIDNQNATQANATKDKAYKMHTNKYIKHDPSKPIITNVRKKRQQKGTEKLENAHKQAIAIEF